MFSVKRSKSTLVALGCALGVVVSGTTVALSSENGTTSGTVVSSQTKVKTIPGAPMAPVNPMPHTRPSDDRPNIILISTDDQRNDEMRFLPKTRALISDRGIRFDQSLSPHPLCCPARAEILSGQYAQNNGVRTNFPPQGGYKAFDADHQIGTWMNAAGYNTAFLGKPINGYGSHKSPDPGWTIWDATSHGYADYYDFTQVLNNGAKEIKNEYYTDYLNRVGVNYMQQLSGYDAPFFMWVSHFGPHSSRPEGVPGGGEDGHYPPAVAKRYKDTYGPQVNGAARRKTGAGAGLAWEYAQDLLKKPSFNEDNMNDKPGFLSKRGKSSREKTVDFVYSRAGALAAVDDAVAAYIKELDELGELDNTYIFFTTDNGYTLGEHRYFGKIMPYEEDLLTPMLVRGPGIKAGQRSNQVVTTIDLPATFVDIANATVDRKLDSVSFLPMLEGNKNFNPHGNTVLIQGGPVKSETGKTGWFYRGVRTQRYTFVKYYDGHIELYDRAKDPYQVNSVAADPRYKNVKQELLKRTVRLSTCEGASQCNHKFGNEPTPR